MSAIRDRLALWATWLAYRSGEDREAYDTRVGEWLIAHPLALWVVNVTLWPIDRLNALMRPLERARSAHLEVTQLRPIFSRVGRDVAGRSD